MLLRDLMTDGDQRMRVTGSASHIFRIGLAMLAVSSWVHSYAADSAPAETSNIEDPCDYAFNEMVLKRTWSQSDQMLAAFEIRLATIVKEPVVIEGWRKKDGFHIGRPDVSFEFKDLTGGWNELPGLPGSFTGPPDRLLVSNDKRAEVIATLPPTDTTEKAIEWRLVLRDKTGCRKSLPFRMIRKKGPVEGYVSDPVPDFWNQKSGESCDCDRKAQPKK